jgi:hypothetical protein
MGAEKDILDFIIIGAQKAGTTSLFRYLRQHPEVAFPHSKEAPFFCVDDAYSRGFASYMKNITRELEVPDPARKWGTSTPHYMAGGVYQSTSESAVENGYDERTVPTRMRESLPDVRLVAILRDPVERALSGHREAVMKGQDRRSFDDAISELLQPDALLSARRRPQHMGTGYVAWGEYGRILAGYFDVFPREQILVVFTDELERAPAPLLSRIQQFIGVEADFVPDDLGEKYNSGVAARQFSWRSPSTWMSPYSPVSPQGVQLALRHNSAVRAVWDVVPEGSQRRMRRRYQRVARRAALKNQRAGGDPVSAATLERLREHYSEDTAQLADLLGVIPPWASDRPA